MRPLLLRTALVICSAVAAVTATAAGTARPAAAGGPYSLDDTVPIAWYDISAAGTPITDLAGADDGFYSDIPIGFTFDLAGDAYTELEVTTNGVISLAEENNPQYDNEALPTDEWFFDALLPWWDDFYPPGSEDDAVYYAALGTAPERVFIVQWESFPHIDSEDAGYAVSFQVALCEGSNNVVFQYLDAVFGDPSSPGNDNGGSATVGIQFDSSSALEYSFEQQVIDDDMAIVFYPTGAGGSPDNCVQPLVDALPTPTATEPPPTATSAPPSGLSLSAGDTSLAAGEQTEITATVTDDAGNPVAGSRCVFHVVSQPGNSANVDPGPFATNAEGEASTTLHAGNTPGTLQVQAACGPFTQVLDVVVSPAALPSTGAGGNQRDAPYRLVALAAGLALLGLGGLRLRRA